jgi:exosortase
MASSPAAQPRSLPPAVMAILAASGLGLFWAYWPVFTQIAGHWWKDPQYSHGGLVPLFALFLLWWRRDLLAGVTLQTNYWGLLVLTAGVALRLFGARYGIPWPEQISLLPCLAGLVLLLGSWPALRWAWPSIAFLAFMIPLPYSIETALARELRLTAAASSVYVIQTLGLPTLREEADIILGSGERVPVAPACCGIGMLLTFFALATAIILLSKRPWVDKLVIVLSAIPIAIVANIVRVTITAFLYEFVSGTLARKLIHDWAGYLMMPVGLLILWLELKILDHLFIVESDRPVDLDFAKPKFRENIKAAPSRGA